MTLFLLFCNIPIECCSETKTYYLCSVESFNRHIESVFALSLTENVEVFKDKGATNSTHFLFRARQEGNILIHSSSVYLFKCGVLQRRLFLFRFFHNLRLDKRNQLHTFFLYLPTVSGAARYNVIYYEKIIRIDSARIVYVRCNVRSTEKFG